MPEISVGGNRNIGTTLIITPLSILDQWKSEIAAHAPSVRGRLIYDLCLGKGTKYF